MPQPQGRREAILARAAELFAAKGIAATNVREIADGVGILSGSLYHHFDSKQAIVEEILTSYLEDLKKSYAAVLADHTEPRDRFRGLIGSSLDIAGIHPHAAEIYQSDGNYLRGLPHFEYLNDAARDIQRTWVNVITAGVKTGAFRHDIEPKVFYRLVRDSLWLSVRWYKPTKAYPVEQFADDCTKVYLDGFAAPKG